MAITNPRLGQIVYRIGRTDNLYHLITGRVAMLPPPEDLTFCVITMENVEPITNYFATKEVASVGWITYLEKEIEQVKRLCV